MRSRDIPEDDPAASGDDRPSKTRLKKDMIELQKLGEALLELPGHKLDAIDMPENLRDALAELRRVRSHEGRRRQLQYVGKLMRQVDPEPLREAVAAQRVPGARETLALHEAERWRERLLSDDTALTDWLAAHPQADAQALRALIRNARKDGLRAQSGQANDGAVERRGRAYRELFQHVRAALDAARDNPDTALEDDDE